jgi:hypothetical protein
MKQAAKQWSSNEKEMKTINETCDVRWFWQRFKLEISCVSQMFNVGMTYE